jgi:hypothetical protein
VDAEEKKKIHASMANGTPIIPSPTVSLANVLTETKQRTE